MFGNKINITLPQSVIVENIYCEECDYQPRLPSYQGMYIYMQEKKGSNV